MDRHPEQIAQKYLGMTEMKGNRFSDDTALGKMVRAAGQKDGEAWCCYYAEGVFCETYPEHEAELRKRFSANCVQTLANFREAGYEVTLTPVTGALMIMQKFKDGVPQTTGHAGVVSVEISSWQFRCIEGNSNDDGSREGYEVAENHRKVLAEVQNGLKVVGFVNIKKKLESL